MFTRALRSMSTLRVTSVCMDGGLKVVEYTWIYPIYQAFFVSIYLAVAIGCGRPVVELWLRTKKMTLPNNRMQVLAALATGGFIRSLYFPFNSCLSQAVSGRPRPCSSHLRFVMALCGIMPQSHAYTPRRHTHTHMRAHVTLTHCARTLVRGERGTEEEACGNTHSLVPFWCRRVSVPASLCRSLLLPRPLPHPSSLVRGCAAAWCEGRGGPPPPAPCLSRDCCIRRHGSPRPLAPLEHAGVFLFAFGQCVSACTCS